jgi:glycosyltransferase involved in cell wall biosynthesis
MTDSTSAGHWMPRLLVAANDLFHPVGHRIQHLLPYLKRRFHVRVVSLAPPLPNQAPGQAVKWWWGMLVRGEGLLRHRGAVPALARLALPGAGGPFGNYVLFRRLVARYARHSFDVCLASGPVPGLAATRICRCPVVYEDLDCYGAYGTDPFRRGVVAFMERQCLRHATAVISVGSVLARRARRYRSFGTHVIPNGVDLGLFTAVPPGTAREEDLVVVHGSLERWIGLDTGLQAMAILKAKGVHVRMVVAGRGPGLEHFKQLSARLGLDDVVGFLGPVPHGDIPSLLARGAIGLLCFPDTPFMRCAATLKLAECMASGLPVVVTDVGETAATVRRTGVGIVAGHSPDEVAEGVLSLLMGPGLRRRMARRARRAAAHLDWSELAQRVGDVLLDAMRGSAAPQPPGPPPRLMARA